ncbi:PREDICTED: TIP41-like protein [Priapulus caudatus]|uniref:TIP41-like protein n=1 Tax=Priapulus caudatus TaxID=37621 RepID=A0ABM1F652_PRICU|nr:PREDICTED: TIP41-like protein [Priapulus caudatus]
MAMDNSANTTTKSKEFRFGPWVFTTTKSHILKSICESPEKCKTNIDVCQLCRYGSALKLPHIPEMVFPYNTLRLVHDGGFGIEFNALDALRLVDAEQDLMKVAVADAWKESRASSEFAKDTIKPFDWTFSTSYRGTILAQDPQHVLQVSPTTERIDIEKLKTQENILFFDEVHLFEDELADNGCSNLTVKIRVMPGKFFVLLRFFLRVDGVLIRMNDTRLYHENDKNYMIREYTSKQKKTSDIKAPPESFIDPIAISEHLDTIEEILEKVEFPTLTNLDPGTADSDESPE